MDHATPHDDDRLLERLAAAGTVLDQLAYEAAHPPIQPVHGRRRGRGRHAGHRSGGNGRRVVAALVALLVLAGVVAAVGARSRDDGEAVVADAPVGVLSDAALAGRVAERLDGVAECGPMPLAVDVPAPPNGWQRVTGFDCTEGYIHEFNDGETLVPVYAQAVVEEPIAYWSADAGWVTRAEADDPGFDFARYRTAYLAALDDRLENGPGN